MKSRWPACSRRVPFPATNLIMNRCRGYFITGTDTGVGKTAVTLGLMRLLQARGHTVVAMKPVAAGCEPTPAGLRNDDALRLQRQASIELDYAQINPCAFAPAIAPHIAAEQAGARIDIDKIIKKYKDYTLLDITLKTGRKHQIRCHLAYLGYPIAGDKLYNFKNQICPKNLSRQFLHARNIKIKMPNGKTREFFSELPKNLEQVIKFLNF